MASLPGSLLQFELRASDDEVKIDLELTCTECGEVVCDAEAGDSLAVLASTALAHICGEDPDSPDNYEVPQETQSLQGGNT